VASRSPDQAERSALAATVAVTTAEAAAAAMV